MGSNKLISVCTRSPILTLILLFCPLTTHTALSLPLSTSSHWIVDEPTGSRVKLACVNWASHLAPMLPEGLHHRPLDSIARTVRNWGFNCVRLSWATGMFTNKTLADAMVAQTFQELGLQEELQGIARFNGKLVSLTTVEAFKEVVHALGKEGLMVVLDNRDEDGGDASPDGEIWLQGLQVVASLFKGWPSVVGITLRCDLRRPNQDWYMQRGAEVIISQNSDILVIHVGLKNGEDLHYFIMSPLWERLRQKMVYEVQIPMGQSADGRCETVMQTLWKNMDRLRRDSTMMYTGPLLIGELGLDHVGSVSENEACFVPCFSAFAAQSDMDWAVLDLQGSYYLRQGVRGDDESFGLFNHQWTAPRNGPLMHNLKALQGPFMQDIDRTPPHKLLFHPATGLCVNKVHLNGLEMGSCKEASSWNLSPQGLIVLEYSYLVIGARGANQAAVLELQGRQANGPWTLSNNNFSIQPMQVSTILLGQTLCLDSPTPPTLLTNPCTCPDSPHSSRDTQLCQDNPTSQWFIFVSISH